MPEQLKLNLPDDQSGADPHTLSVYERPADRLRMVGERALSLRELLAIVIGAGAADDQALAVAEQLLAGVGTLSALNRASLNELCAVDGMAPAGAARLKASLELGRRLLASANGEWPRITSPADAANLLIPEMALLEQEHLCTLLLSTRNQVIACPTVYIGSLNTAVVRVAEVFKEAVRQNAHAIIVSHNHPSGDPTPSPEDVRVTRELAQAGRLLGIELLDHLIIGGTRFVSLKERGLGFS